jgi:uncharacterized protein (DUF433 family)/DNA-binding transcriptional MerR regulator
MGQEAYPVGSRTLIRWARHGLASPELVDADGRQMILGFEDLTSLRIIAALRAAGVRWRVIREAESWLREVTNYPRPFARQELWTFSSDVFARFTGQIVATSRHGQIAMNIVAEYLVPVSGLSFEDKVARRWEARDRIVLDPKVQFGEPCLKGTRIPASAVASMIGSGDPKPLVMEAYGISAQEVDAALGWAASVAA